MLVTSASPWDNGSIESCYSQPRDEFLERHEFKAAADRGNLVER